MSEEAQLLDAVKQMLRKHADEASADIEARLRAWPNLALLLAEYKVRVSVDLVARDRPDA